MINADTHYVSPGTRTPEQIGTSDNEYWTWNSTSNNVRMELWFGKKIGSKKIGKLQKLLNYVPEIPRGWCWYP